MVQMAWTFINDRYFKMHLHTHYQLNGYLKKIQFFISTCSLCTTLCIQWEPEIIAIALMYLATKLSKLQIISWANKKPNQTRWWENFVEDLQMDVLEGKRHLI